MAAIIKNVHERLKKIGVPLGDVEVTYETHLDEKSIEDAVKKQKGELGDFESLEEINVQVSISELQDSINLPNNIKLAYIDIGENSLIKIMPASKEYELQFHSDEFKNGGQLLRKLLKTMNRAGFKEAGYSSHK